MKQDANAIPRVIALDTHPDSFTAAVLRGPTPAAAVVEKLDIKSTHDKSNGVCRANLLALSLHFLVSH